MSSTVPGAGRWAAWLAAAGAAVLVAVAGATATAHAAARSGGAPPKLLERITVSNTSAKAVTSTTSLDARSTYTIVARGVVSDWTAAADGITSGEPFGVDALYCYAKWRCGATPQLWRQLQVDGKGLDELAAAHGHAEGILISRDQDELVIGSSSESGVGTDGVPYAADHAYSVSFTGISGQLSLVGLDALGSAGDNTGSWRVDLYRVAGPQPGAATTSAATRGLVSLASVSNGCGGGTASSDWRVGDTSTYLNSNSPLGTRYKVNFRAACNLHDAGYSGAKVLDPFTGRVTDFRGWTQAQVDDKFLADMRSICDRSIPAAASVALADCKARGGKTSLGAESRYNFVHSQGYRFFRARVDLNGRWTAAGGEAFTVVEADRVVTVDWQPKATQPPRTGAFQLHVSEKGAVTIAVGGRTLPLTRG